MFDSTKIKIYNSLTNAIENFTPLKPGEISMYVCGPTVYNDIHIGNGRPVVFFDTVKRFFEYLGFKVVMVENFTDIDDKIIKKASEEKVTDSVISERYIKAFLKVCEDSGCEMDLIHPKVTENIPEILTFIQMLIDKGYAYASGDDVYFRVRKVKNYGILSNQKVDDLESGARIDVNTNKEDALDFTLWKKTDDTGRKWPSDFGAGRPGWHTECVVMINKIFGGMIDIHGGGSDLKFPHHENEIAQAMACYNNTIANYWIHNARIDLKNEKMSKSLGNVVWLKDVLKEFPAEAYRLFVLANHYRQTISYLPEQMTTMVNEWQKLRKTYLNLYRHLELQASLPTGSASDDMMNSFLEAMAYDFNTANALTAIYELVKMINVDLRNKASLDKLQSEYLALKDMFYVFGLNPSIKPLTTEELTLVQTWQNARNNKDFVVADAIRTQITEAGIEL